MDPIQFTKLSSQDLEQVYQIDRSERIERMYRPSGEQLEAYDDCVEVESDPGFWKQLLAWWREELESGADAYGAFDGDTLTGIAIVKHGCHEAIDQIIAMYVSAEYRLSGIAKSLYLEIEAAARASGAKKLFVSTTPSGSAVGFYQSQGFEFDAGSACQINDRENSEIPMIKRL